LGFPLRLLQELKNTIVTKARSKLLSSILLVIIGY
jgi:hypothetical protein